MRRIPAGLKLGTATSAYQIEGAWNVADKTPSIWDNFCRTDAIMDKTTGDDACKSYEYYKRDVEMLKFLGVEFYRFSISWTRLLPNGFTNKISEDGLNYYNNLINSLLENNIDPVITMFHWDLPQNLQDLGGWANPLIVDWFGDYARVLYTVFGDRVKTWITLNEPRMFGVGGYGYRFLPPAINACGVGEYIAAKNIAMAHARAWHIYNDEFRATQKGVCGITIASDFRVGATDSHDDIEQGLDAVEFEIGIYSHPIFSSKGGFPDRVVKKIAAKSAEQGYPRSRLPEFTQSEIEYCKGASDFYGFNHYATKFFTKDKYVSGMYPAPSYQDDIGGTSSYLDYETTIVPHVAVIPHGIRLALNWVKENCNNPRIMITENGFASLEGLDDLSRISYHRQYLECVLDAIELDGCNVVSYTAWSLMDNFEWIYGLKVRFGLFEVDFNDEKRKRTARASAYWFKNLIATRCLHNDPVPRLEYSV